MYFLFFFGGKQIKQITNSGTGRTPPPPPLPILHTNGVVQKVSMRYFCMHVPSCELNFYTFCFLFWFCFCEFFVFLFDFSSKSFGWLHYHLYGVLFFEHIIAKSAGRVPEREKGRKREKDKGRVAGEKWKSLRFVLHEKNFCISVVMKLEHSEKS